MSGKKKHTTPNEYLKYLKRDLTNQERHSFERNLEADSFEKEAMEGFEQLSPEQAEEDILSLHARMRKRLSRRKRNAVYSIAATVASLLIVGTVFLQIHDFHPSSDEPAKSSPVETLTEEAMTEEAMTMEAQTDDETAGGAITRDHTTRESSEEPDKEEQVMAVEKDTEDDRKATKGPSKAAEAPVAEVPVAVAPVAAVPVAEVQDVQVPQEDTEAVQITYTEAQPMAMEEEAPETRSRKRANQRKESLSQPVTERPQEMSKKAISQEEFDKLISGEAGGMVISAEPSGGFKAYKKYIEENIQFPAEDTTTERAVVILKFTVTPAGEIKEIMELRSPEQPFTNEAIRVVMEGPKWSPASDETGTIEEIIRLRIVFKK